MGSHNLYTTAPFYYSTTRGKEILQPLDLLARTDKWYVGGGNRLIWTPAFPEWLDTPGFWDPAQYYNHDIQPVFTWTILDENGKELPVRAAGRMWDPSGLVTGFRPSTGGLSIRETKCSLPEGRLAALLSIRNTQTRARRLHLVLWTVLRNTTAPGGARLEGLEYVSGEIRFRKYFRRPGREDFSCECALGMGCAVHSWSIELSEGSVLQPHWRLTPFFETFRNGRLPSARKLSGVTEEGLVFLALHTRLSLPARAVKKRISLFFDAAPSREELTGSAADPDPVAASRLSWLDHFAGVPYFECSDEYLTRYYWYRWYGLKLLTLSGHEKQYRHKVVCEGIGYFRAPISYSAACHMLENRWMHDPALARGSLLTFIDNQRADGGFRGYIDLDYYRQEMFYHANWGLAVRELDALHPDPGYLERVYNGLVRYVDYFDRERCPDGDGLYDIHNHYETGQEYMHRYTAVSPHADRDNWGEVFRLKGVDVTVYLYELKKTLSLIARKLSRPAEEQKRWQEGAGRIGRALLETMWDPVEEMFFDVDPSTGKRTMVKAAVCFYPYMTDIVSREHRAGLRRHLLNRREFWTPYPVPSSSADDEYFSAEPEWKGKRMNCPWNGRVWPMTNSHIAEALAQSAIRWKDPFLRKKAGEFIRRFVAMMFFEADPTRPNCFEHYNPLTGQPSAYRGVDDYQHSWVNDLIIKYAAGLRVEGEHVVVDPLPFGLTSCVLNNVLVRGRLLDVERVRDVLVVRVDGKELYRGTLPVNGLVVTMG